MKKLSMMMVTCCVALLGCGGDKADTASTATKQEVAQTNGDVPVYRVAALTAYPPFSQDNAKGSVEGFDVDIINHIAQAKGFKVEYKPQSIWSGMLEGLDEGKHDITLSSVFITPERQARYDFSNPYMSTGFMLVFKDDTATGKTKFNNFNEALAKNTTFTTEFHAPVHATLTNLLNGRSDVSFVNSSSPFAQISTVIQGKAQAAYDNQRVYEYYIYKFNNDPKTKIYGVLDTNTPASPVGFAVKKGNTALVEKLNAGLAEMQANGKLGELQQKWFGQTF